MKPKRLLMISTDRKLLEEGSAVRVRHAAYAKEWDEVHIIVYAKRHLNLAQKSEILNPKQARNQKFEEVETETTIAPNCWAYSTRSRLKGMNAFGAIRLGRFIISQRGITDITCQDPFMTAIAASSLKKRFPELKWEIQVHTDVGSPNFSYTIGNRIRRSLALTHLPRADKIRVVSGRIKTFLTEKLGIAASKIEVRPIVVDTSFITSAPITVDLHKKYPHFKKIVLMASRLEAEKNISLALNSLPIVLKAIPNAGLVIVGSGGRAYSLKAKAHRLGIGSSAVFESWADKVELASYYKTADAFLSTSLYEGYGLTFVEAKAAGCLIVSTDVGVAREMGANIVEWNKESVARGIIGIISK